MISCVSNLLLDGDKKKDAYEKKKKPYVDYLSLRYCLKVEVLLLN